MIFGEHAPAGSRVHLRRVVILLVDALQTAQQHQNFEGQRVPHDVDNHDEHVRPVFRALVNPVDVVPAEKLNDIIDNALGLNQTLHVRHADDVEHRGENHADGDGVGHIGQEEDGLQYLLQGLDGVQRNRNQQRENRRNWHGEQAQEHRVFQRRLEAAVADNRLEVLDANGEGGTADFAQAVVVIQECQPHRVDNRPDRKDQQQHDGRGKIEPCFPLMLAFYHLTSPRTECECPRHPA